MKAAIAIIDVSKIPRNREPSNVSRGGGGGGRGGGGEGGGGRREGEGGGGGRGGGEGGGGGFVGKMKRIDRGAIVILRVPFTENSAQILSALIEVLSPAGRGGAGSIICKIYRG